MSVDSMPNLIIFVSREPSWVCPYFKKEKCVFCPQLALYIFPPTFIDLRGPGVEKKLKRKRFIPPAVRYATGPKLMDIIHEVFEPYQYGGW